MPRHFLAAAAALALTILPAAAQDLDARFDLSLRGITGGQIVIRGVEQNGGYSVAASARATGLVGSLVKYGYEGQAQGRLARGRLVSARYVENEDDDGERTSAVTTFEGGRPTGVTFTPPRKPKSYDIEPTAQSGVTDPLTALFAVLRVTGPDGACGFSIDLFDGRHVSRLVLGAPTRGEGGTITCAAEYRRIRGYSADEMAEKPAVPLTMIYGPAGGGRVQVTEIRSPTRFGTAVLRRR